MVQAFVEFERPPVVELVLGVQFAPLVNFTGAHVGWFWKQFLGNEWTRATETVPILDQFERFDEQRHWGIPDLRVLVAAPGPPARFQVSTAAEDRMIQVQATRFHYNWVKKDQVYPHYARVRAEFDAHLARFREFVGEAGLGEVLPNQWEITYVDQVPRGELWQSPADWHRVLPGLLAPAAQPPGLGLDNVAGEWHYEITPRRGRLHFAVQQGRAGEGGESALVLQTTARGPIANDADNALGAGLDLGHEVAVRGFLQITSAEAHKAWEMRTR
jgi:uncharacterized protein (TIGR04255 family)